MASPHRNNKGVKKLRKIIRDKKAISTILAALLMVVIVVVASVMVYAWSTGLLGSLLVTPTTGKEALNSEAAAFATNNTVVTLNLRNIGTASINLVTYYVKDTSGNTYTVGTWAGPTIAPNGVNPTSIGIGIGAGGSCPSGCTLSGNAYTFTAGFSYTVTVVTSRNSQFVFTVTR
jgi:FlaG/FlaF family flagellin (archaellin)